MVLMVLAGLLAALGPARQGLRVLSSGSAEIGI